MAEISHTQSGHGPVKIRSKKFTTRIDMTPMVDLAFLLLTFFILTTTLNQLMVLEIVVPEKVVNVDPPPVPASHVLTLVLGEKDKVYWRRGVTDDFERIDYPQITKLLSSKNGEIERMALFIKSSIKSRYQNFVDVMDDVAKNKIDRYYVVDLEPEDEQLIREAEKKNAVSRSGN